MQIVQLLPSTLRRKSPAHLLRQETWLVLDFLFVLLSSFFCLAALNSMQRITQAQRATFMKIGLTHASSAYISGEKVRRYT